MKWHKEKWLDIHGVLRHLLILNVGNHLMMSLNPLVTWGILVVCCRLCFPLIIFLYGKDEATLIISSLIPGPTSHGRDIDVYL